MAITTKFLRDIREGVEVADSLEGKLDKKASQPELDGAKVAMKEEDSDDIEVSEEDKVDLKKEKDDEMDLEMKEEEKEEEKKDLEMKEEEKEEEKKDLEMKEEDEMDLEMKEEEDAMDLEMKEEDEKLDEDDEKKLEKEEDAVVKEAAAALTKDEDLPESFKIKVASIFEAAVKRASRARIDAHKKKMMEGFNKKLSESKSKISNTLTTQVDGYLDYVAEEWMKENQVAIESALRSTITEKFIGGLKSLFESHYIEVPVEKANILSKQETTIKNLEKELNGELIKNVELRKENIKLKKSSMVKKLTEGMSLNDASKFAELCEGVSFDNSVSFGQKLKVIKDTYFPKTKKITNDIDSSLLTEGGLVHDEQQKGSPSDVDVYAQTISRMVKR